MAIDLPSVPEEEATPRTSMTRIGRWELGRTLGRGAYAHVRLATHESGHVSACKILPSLHGPDRKKYTRDQRIDAVEAHKELVMLKGLAGAGIPGIVGLEGVIPCEGWNFIFLSVYPHSAATLSQYPEYIIPFFRRLLISIHGLHMLDISHEDLKRSNVLATSYLEPILVDFGFAHFMPNGGSVRSLGGTLDYSSPEKLSDKYYNPFRSDVWSLGILLLKILGMHNPYRVRTKDTEDEVKHKLIITSPNWSFLRHLGKPGAIGDVIRGMLERDPEVRWTIPEVLDHPSMQTQVPDPEPVYIPSYDLPEDIVITEDIIIDVAFLAYNLGEFVLCENLSNIVDLIVSGERNWYKRWAGLLARWQQREETLWEDVSSATAVNTPQAKAARGSRLSSVDVAGVSRASLRPLREIHVIPQNVAPAVSNHPKATNKPRTPRRKGQKNGPVAEPPKIPRKSTEIVDKSLSTPMKPKLALDADQAPLTPPRRTRQTEQRVFKAAAPKVVARAPVSRLRRKLKPLVDTPKIPDTVLAQSAHEPQTAIMIIGPPKSDMVDKILEPIRPVQSSQATLAPTRRATHTGIVAPKKQTGDKENVPPHGERPPKTLGPPMRGTVNALQPTRRSPRFA